MTIAEREAAAVRDHDCPRDNCRAGSGHPCQYIRGIFTEWVTRTFAHPHAERVALVPQPGSRPGRGMTLAELEADARARHTCPSCRAGSHHSCQNVTGWQTQVRFLKHPHKARTDLARAAEAGRRQTVRIAIRDGSRCSFTFRPEPGHDHGLRCGGQMTTGVYDRRNANLLWRCAEHEGQVDSDTGGLVTWPAVS